MVVHCEEALYQCTFTFSSCVTLLAMFLHDREREREMFIRKAGTPLEQPPIYVGAYVTSCRREAATVCLAPVTLTFDLLTLKVVSESRVTWATSVPILVFLGLSVLDLGPMCAIDRQTGVRQHHRLMPRIGGGHNNNTHIAKRKSNKRQKPTIKFKLYSPNYNQQ